MRKRVQLAEQLTNVRLRRNLTRALLFLFVLNNVAALATLFLVGFGLMVLPEKIVLALLLDTVTQAAACFVALARSLRHG